MNILLIAGHGNGDPGACATFNGVTYREADLARFVVKHLKDRLTPYMGVTVYDTSRCAYDDYINRTLSNRAKFSQQDYVLEIHFNACSKDNGNGSTKGIEAYVPTAETSYGVETAICKNVAACGLRNRGVKKKNWSVIYTAKKAGVSSCLLEVCFIDDADDMKIYGSKFNEIMDGIAKGIVEGFGVGTYKTGTATPTKPAESATATTKPGTSSPASTASDKATAKRTSATEAAHSFSTSLSKSFTVTAEDGLNLRNGAGISANAYGKDKSVLVCLPDGTSVRCYGYYTTVSGTKWLYVTATVNKVRYTGFVSSAYLK